MEAKDKMRKKLNNKEKPISNFRQWCRLCAKQDERNINVFFKNNQIEPDKSLATAIGKYFWVNIKTDDDISQFICSECHTLVDELVSFTERVNKVQTMFYLLQNSTETIDPNELRIQYGLLDEERQHIMQHHEIDIEEEYEEQDTKPTLIFTIEEENDDDEQEIDDTEEYKETLKEFEHNENADAVSTLSNEVELFSETDTSITPKKAGKNNKAQLFKKESNMTLEEKNIHSTEDAEVNVNEDFIYEYTVEDDNDDDDDESLGENHIEEGINDNIVESKTAEKVQIISSKKITKGFPEVRSKRKRGRPLKYRTAEDKADGIASQKRSKIKHESNGDEDEGENSPESVKIHCKLCPKKYKSVVVYRKHMQEVHNVLDQTVVEYHCSQCEKIFQSERQLAAHNLTHLPLELKKTFPCPYCDKKFTKEVIADQHVSGVHFNEKPFVCEECGRALKTNAALKEHKFTHTNDCPYVCAWCPKRFKNKARLKIHMDIHSQTVYTCDECGLELNTRRTLNMHMLVHSANKPHKCDHCGNEFKRAKALKNHLIIHTGLKPYVCEFCNKAFSNGSNCRSHKKKTHPVELAAAEALGIGPPPSNVPKLNHLREVTKQAKNLHPVNKQNGLPSNWRDVLLKAEARAKRGSGKKVQQAECEAKEQDGVYIVLDNDEDMQFDHVDDSQYEEDESAAIIIEKMVSDGKVAEELEAQLDAMHS